MLETRKLIIGNEGHTLAQVHVRACEGKMICLLGPNGCGKSTLLRTLSGLQKPISGEVLLGEQDLHQLADNEKAKHLALVLTERLSIENTRVRDVAAMGRYPFTSFLGGLKEEDEKVVLTALEQVGVERLADRYFNNLSDGEKQRTLIAKALAQATPLILLDEPTAHLDLPNRIRIMLLLRELAHTQKKCVIISTHELDLALQMADEVWLMSVHKDGTYPSDLQVGTPDDLIQSGAFANAFADENFTFENEQGNLRVKIIKKD